LSAVMSWMSGGVWFLCCSIWGEFPSADWPAGSETDMGRQAGLGDRPLSPALILKAGCGDHRLPLPHLHPNNRLRIPFNTPHGPRAMHILVNHSLYLGHPKPHIVSLGIIVFGLFDDIELSRPQQSAEYCQFP